ncbi:MAG: lipoyl synthase [Gammaproteobacteria bacterium]|nr:lipoyl synthase [Gammaproteobacteria bacterium]
MTCSSKPIHTVDLSAAVAAPNATRMPAWIRYGLGQGTDYGQTARAIQQQALHTVCEEARCPNRGDCWSAGTATIMLLGERCTRACGFCSVQTAKPLPVDLDEPTRVVEAVQTMGLRYVVLTSVTRDDLEDGGAAIFADCVKRLRIMNPGLGVELLTPDFHRCQDQAIEIVAAALEHETNQAPKLVWGHNMETVPRLYRVARKAASYERSLNLLRNAAALPGVEAKSAMMLGLGETEAEILQVMTDLREAGVQRLVLGQYLRPSMKHLPVEAYIHPDQFEKYENHARDLGFSWAKCSPLARSSYHAEEIQQP